jgi:hypothetical protein
MYKICITILASAYFVGCTNKNNVQHIGGTNEFTVTIDSVELPMAVVEQTFIYKDNIVFISIDGKQLAYNINTLSKVNINIKSSPKQKEDAIPGYPLFDDATYKVTQCCGGEFGGSIFFYNKKTNETHTCPATCANTVFKSPAGSYIVTSSLAHMSTSSDIIEIKNPEKLISIKTDTIHCNWWADRINTENFKDYQRRYDSLMNGTKNLLDVHGMLLLNTFYYNDSLYSIGTVYPERNGPSLIPNICLLHIIDNKAKIKAKIFEGRFKYDYFPHGSSQPSIFRGYDNEYGFIEVKENNIRIVIFK